MNLIWAWVKRLLKKYQSGKSKKIFPWPTADEIMGYPWFDGLPPERIFVISTPEGAQRAFDELIQAKVVGFDTESRPTFRKGELSDGPHIVQFSSNEKAFIFMLHYPACQRVASALIQSSALKKVGFGLGDDLKRIRAKLKVEPKEVVDLETIFSAKGYGRGVGVKVAVAIAFRRRFRKSKKISTTNWSARHLSHQQILYAANDAFAPIKIFDAISSRKPGIGSR